MDYHALEKHTVAQLRDMLKEKDPEHKGLSGLKKPELVDLLAGMLGIEKPHATAAGTDKASIKASIRELKGKRAAAAAAKDKAGLRDTRRSLHELRRKLRRAIRIAG